MPLSAVTLETLMHDLRSRLPIANRQELLETELERFLNLGQYDTAVKLSGINTIWYGTKQTVTISSDTIDLSSYSIMRIIKLVDQTNGLVPFFDEKYFDELSKNVAYDSTRAVTHFGTELDVFEGVSAPTVGTLKLYYYRNPVEMTSSLAMDIPIEFQDMIVSFAEKKALQRLGISTEMKEQELVIKWRAIQEAYGNEFALEQAGERGSDG